MKLLILTGTLELNRALSMFLKYVFGIPEEHIFHFTFDSLPTQEAISETDVWILEGINPHEPHNPVGWRTAKVSGKKVLVLFLFKPQTLDINEEYFFTFSPYQLRKKLKEVMERDPPSKEMFEKVEKKWTALKYQPSHHHGKA